MAITIFQSLAPMAIVSKICLCLPFKRNKDGSWRVSVALALVGFCFQITAVAGVTYNTIKKYIDINAKGDPYLLLSFFHAIGMQLHRVIFIINGPINYRKIVQCLDDLTLLSTKICVSQRYYWKILAVNSAQVIYVLFIPTLLATQRAIMGEFSIATPVLCIILSSVNLLEIHPINLLFVVRGFLTALHEKLLDLNKRIKTKPSGTLATVKKINGKSNITEMFTSCTMAEELSEIRSLYRQVWDLKNNLIDAYSFQLLMTIGQTFLQLVYYAFLNFLMNKDMEKSLEILNKGNVITIKVWTTLLAFKIIWMVSLCHIVVEAFKRTGQILHSLWGQNGEPATRQEILVFSAELSHLDPTISAYGTFYIDRSLLLSMVAAIVMYFPILIQANLSGFSGADSPVLKMTYFSI